jgi:hypothetical protein
MICNHPPSPTQVSVGELYIQGIERQRGEPFSTGKAGSGGDPKHTTVKWKEIFFCSLHKMMETGELFVVYRECDEDRNSEAAMGKGGGRAAPRFSN